MQENGTERFLIQSKPEIIRILRSLIQQRAMLSANLEGGQASLITTLLLIDPERDLVALDYGPAPRINERVLAAGKLFCIAKLDQVEVKFTVHEVKEARLEGQPVFCARLPQTLYYPQRRGCYRLILPKTSPLVCTVRLDDGQVISLSVIDISVGGLGLIDPVGAAPLIVGGVYPDCRLTLPGFGELAFDLEVRSLSKLNPGQRVGCAFLHLKPNSMALIQRYLNQEQIKLRKMMPDKPSSPHPSR